MKIPDHVLDLMLVGAIAAICLVPHGSRAASAAAAPAAEPVGCERTAPARAVEPAPAASPLTVAPTPAPAMPVIKRIPNDPCPACGMG